MDVFISYSKENEAEAKIIEQKLRERNITSFLASETIQGGELFKNEIRNNLIECEELFLLLSPASLRSEWVHVEYGAAWALEKRIVPILFRCKPQELSNILGERQAEDFHNIDKVIDHFEARHRIRKEIPDVRAGEKKLISDGRYFIGIDIGAGTIDYCLFDAECIPVAIHCPTNEGILYEGHVPTPDKFEDIYYLINEIIQEIADEAIKKNLKPISGMGIGLPGMVNPNEGMLVHSPSFGVQNDRVVARLEALINWKGGIIKNLIPSELKTIPIEIDNDVRCATRWRWLRYSPKAQSIICIFIGNGLGSGLVLNGKMFYGKNFLAGEAGHTTINYGPDLFKTLNECHCGKKGHHWEMHVCSYGVLQMLENLNPNEFKRFEAEYEEYIHLLKEEQKSMTFAIGKALHDGDRYASKIVDIFFKYVAIGVANYVHILNPEEIVLGGGMIRAFCEGKDPIPYFECSVYELLKKKINQYALSQFRHPLSIELNSKQYLSSLGAALIFKDNSYFEHKQF